ncbi:MAG: ExbD/TolR family protein [Candidatus Acidiferrales bacterium]
MRLKLKATPVMSDINVIPMADIMLCLLIIFMVVTPMLSPGPHVDLAVVNNARDMPGLERDDAIVVGISRDGTIYLGNERVDRGSITSRVRDLLAHRVDEIVYVKSDARARYGDVVGVVDELRAAGGQQLALLTERKRNPSAGLPDVNDLR